MLIAFGLLWALRPPMLRDPITPAPAVFFMMLPTQVHSMLAPELLKDDREEPRAT